MQFLVPRKLEQQLSELLAALEAQQDSLGLTDIQVCPGPHCMFVCKAAAASSSLFMHQTCMHLHAFACVRAHA